ncbi:MAG: VanZ family protein, partial [Acidobacteriota bacterium]|nr:VanZ family protein [Acidobacteriota bacterium]
MSKEKPKSPGGQLTGSRQIDESGSLPLFSSDRERRLWFWTLLVVAAIYSTLGLASTLAGAIPDILAAFGFVAGMLLVGATVLTQGLKTKPRGLEIAVGLGIAVVYLMVFLRIAIPERSHLIEYGVVAVFVYEAITERKGNGRRVYLPALLAIFLTTFIGALDEGIQFFLPSRVFDPRDILFNGLAAMMAVAASFSLNRV